MAQTSEIRIGVIGGGLGGLAAACTLAARGYEVTLFERNAWLGGKAAVLEEDGFRFDMGPTILTDAVGPAADLRRGRPRPRRRPRPRPARPAVALLLRRRLDARPRRRRRARWRRRSTRSRPARAPATATASSSTCRERLHDISERYFFWRSIGAIARHDRPRARRSSRRCSATCSRMRMGRTVAGHGAQVTCPTPRVAQMLDHFTQYVGSAPDASPAVLCGIAHMQTGEGIWYPRGGTRAVPEALREPGAASSASSSAPRPRCRRDPRRRDGRRRRGRDRRRRAGRRWPPSSPTADSRAHPPRAARRDRRAARRFERRRGYEPACSGVVLYLGLDRALRSPAAPQLRLLARPARGVRRRSTARASPRPTRPATSARPPAPSPDVAPPGGEALYVLVHTPYLRPHHDWKRMLPDYRRVILDKLKTHRPACRTSRAGSCSSAR